MSVFVERFHFPSCAWTWTFRRHADELDENCSLTKSLGCLTRLGKDWGLDSAVWSDGLDWERVMSPTPHFPLPVYSFSSQEPPGCWDSLSCVDFIVCI